MTTPRKLAAKRLPGNPIVRPDMLPEGQGDNIDGPALVAAPDWLPGRLGRFYLYFAHHDGRSIRLAYADRLDGPWRVYGPGTLQLADAVGCTGHVASPDIHVDEATRRIVMYFHGPDVRGGGQRTYFAQSSDGIRFTAGPDPLARFYLRVVRWRGEWIGMAKGGVMYRGSAPEGPFRELEQPAFPMSDPDANGAGDVRHVALDLESDVLRVYYSRIGDAPEHIRRARLDLRRPERQWRAESDEPVLLPEHDWEGAGLPVVPSLAGAAAGRENGLRDPAIFVHDGRRYLLYSVAGESGIAIAELA